MLFLASSLRRGNLNQILYLGFRTASQIPAIPLESLGMELIKARIATDDGSRGFKGTVTQAMETEGWWKCEAPHLFACGPQAMLASIASLAAARGFPAHVSVEQWMACGVGACHGCVLPASAGGYLRACADGPVFDSRDLSWEQ
jgi:dihydroorotate dehydrogenase electron transfer subunit